MSKRTACKHNQQMCILFTQLLLHTWEWASIFTGKHVSSCYRRTCYELLQTKICPIETYTQTFVHFEELSAASLDIPLVFSAYHTSFCRSRMHTATTKQRISAFNAVSMQKTTCLIPITSNRLFSLVLSQSRPSEALKFTSKFSKWNPTACFETR